MILLPLTHFSSRTWKDNHMKINPYDTGSANPSASLDVEIKSSQSAQWVIENKTDRKLDHKIY